MAEAVSVAFAAAHACAGLTQAWVLHTACSWAPACCTRTCCRCSCARCRASASRRSRVSSSCGQEQTQATSQAADGLGCALGGS